MYQHAGVVHKGEIIRVIKVLRDREVCRLATIGRSTTFEDKCIFGR
jgi:hypothetical protein